MDESRRDFVKTIGLVTVSATLGLSGSLSSCAGTHVARFSVNGSRLAVGKNEFAGRAFVLVKPSTMPAPIYVRRLHENDYVAVLLECTHRQCELNPAGEILACPCHGSEYSITGEVLNPPAETKLQRFNVTYDVEFVYVEMK